MLRRLFVTLLLLLPLAAAAQPKPPLVLAAASMQEALTDAAAAWGRAGHPRPVLSFAGSSALARQIVAGAPADLFVSADIDWMTAADRAGRVVPGTRAIVARNRLVVVSRPGARRLGATRGAALAALLATGPLAMADPEAVPAGKYGMEALRRLGAWQAVAPRVVRAQDVRAALALVARGAARYGIVYATDARAEPGVVIAGVFPERSHAPIVYPVARLKAAPSPREAETFRRFLLGPAGRTILARRGFAAP